MAFTGTHDFTPNERIAVEKHRCALTERLGCEVSFEDAARDWNDHCCIKWREQRQAEILAAQRLEIDRYKWIESEKAGHDLGKDAVMDWIKKNAAAWRNWYEQECGNV